MNIRVHGYDLVRFNEVDAVLTKLISNNSSNRTKALKMLTERNRRSLKSVRDLVREIVRLTTVSLEPVVD